MGFRLFVVRSVVTLVRESRNAGVLLLATTMISPAQGADWSKQSFAPGALGGQAGAQQQNAGNNSLASNLGKVAAVLSMAAGGLYMAKGATQLKCCSSGCSGSGTESQAAKKNLDDSTKNKASTIKRQPVDYQKLRFPDEAANCPARPRFQPFRVFDFFQPPKADAALGPCLDAMIALATGGLMLLNGIMSLQAANQAGQMANASAANADNMGSTAGLGTSPTPDGPGNSKLGTGGSSQSPIKLDPALLRTGKANDIMNQFENKFGIPRDQFANGVLNGDDPRKLLGAAPKNALSNDDMNKATSGAKGMSDAEKAAALNGSLLGDAQRELASKMGTGAGKDEYAVNPGGGSGKLSAFKGDAKKGDGDLDGLEDGAKPSDAPGVSPEVQAALAAKELDDRRNGITDLSIFEVVHLKYREKSKMIFGYDPDGVPKGVNRRDGM